MTVSSEALNGDLSLRALMRAGEMVWQQSPSGSVWRKRFHLVGGAESGQVTSIVRYDRDSSFPVHDHPDGEEILVLEGTFSDEHGDWPAGTYLLNPQGFRHAPFSRQGCLLFVKLRQYAGADRHHVALPTDEMPWRPGSNPGIEIKTLYSAPGFDDETRLERWRAGAAPGALRYPGGVEILVIRGTLEDEHGVYGEQTWLRLPPGGTHTPRSPDGCELYVKTAALPALRSITTGQSS
jgi:anti-sigma factor ChrR (cupin superfamily)